MNEPLDICIALAKWAEAANVISPNCGSGILAISKSDLLNRLIYGEERGPSQTHCPIHKGKWSGCYWWGEIPLPKMLQEWWDAGCRCHTHKGSGCNTGWNPDEFCCKTLK